MATSHLENVIEVVLHLTRHDRLGGEAQAVSTGVVAVPEQIAGAVESPAVDAAHLGGWCFSPRGGPASC